MSRLDDLKAAMPSLVDEARQRSREFETNRQLSNDFVAKLKAAGAFLILIPSESGGLGGSLIDWFKMGLQLAEADASTGWVTMHGAGANALLYALADRRLSDVVFADPLACAAWSNAPTELACTETAEGYRISCRWAFGTGCMGSSYVGGMVPRTDASGQPRPIAALMPIAAARIDRTWDPIGLGGTGSHDIVFDDVFVPRHNTFGWPGGASVASYPSAIVSPGLWFIGACAAAVHLGLGRRAIDEARHALTGKNDRSGAAPILAHPAVMRTLERAEGLLFACQAGVRTVLDDAWAQAQAGVPLTTEQRLRSRLSMVTAVQEGAGIVRTVFDSVGTIGAKRSGVLEQVLRDASCLPQQISVNPFSFEATGRVRGGFAPLDGRV